MILSFKYRIYPNKQQQEILNKNFNFCCFLYNAALEERQNYYKKYKKGISYGDQSLYLPEIKEEFKEQTETIYSQTLQQVLKRVDLAYQNFFRRVKQKSSKAGFPRFKSKDRFRSLCFPQSNFKGRGVKLLEDNKNIKIFGLPGEVKIVLHRPYQGTCKQVQIIKKADKYYVILTCDNVSLNPLPKTNKEIGIDLGLTSFITLDDGTKFHHPKPYKTAKEKLATKQRRLDKKQKDSQNSRKLKNKISKLYEKVYNIRSDFLHKTSANLVKEYDKIYLEDLNVKNMMEAESFHVKKDNITDASWARFASLLKYKAERAGKLIIKVDPRNTSKKCSNCGNIKKELKLSERTYCCEACGFEIDRDQNAAINIKKLGISFAIS